jgi:hypothetical protein
MSRIACWVLGSFALLFAATFVLTVSNSPEPLLLWICAGFCVLISLACFSTVAHGPAIRLIGATVFAVYAFYLFDALSRILRTPLDGHFHWRWLTAFEGPFEGLIVFGLPGLYVAIRGRYPLWGKAAPAFLGKNYCQDEEQDRQLQKLE